jgi:hypothetical protein
MVRFSAIILLALFGCSDNKPDMKSVETGSDLQRMATAEYFAKHPEVIAGRIDWAQIDSLYQAHLVMYKLK